jgi:hypothetical protein
MLIHADPRFQIYTSLIQFQRKRRSSVICWSKAHFRWGVADVFSKPKWVIIWACLLNKCCRWATWGEHRINVSYSRPGGCGNSTSPKVLKHVRCNTCKSALMFCIYIRQITAACLVLKELGFSNCSHADILTPAGCFKMLFQSMLSRCARPQKKKNCPPLGDWK